MSAREPGCSSALPRRSGIDEKESRFKVLAAVSSKHSRGSIMPGGVGRFTDRAGDSRPRRVLNLKINPTTRNAIAVIAVASRWSVSNVRMETSAAYSQVWTNAKLATFDPAVSAPYGLRDGWSLAVRDGTIAAILPPGDSALHGFRGTVTDCGGRWITPGFIDCHTHLVYGGSRALDWELRLSGVPYTEIAKRGGGILSTVRTTRALSESQLLALALPRLRALVAEGVTCVEISRGMG